MKRTLILLVVSLFSIVSLSQTTIKMKRQGGVSIVPCKVNGLDLSFIFDTGASDVTISLTEALFMLKNGYLSESDITGTANYTDAKGEISEGYTIVLKEIEFAGLKLFNVKASIVATLDAPLLLGQTAISKLGRIELDLASNTLIILNGNSTFDYSAYKTKDQSSYSSQSSTMAKSATYALSGVELQELRQEEMKEIGSILRVSADETSEAIYWIPKETKVTLVEKGSSYVKVTINGKTGYISIKDYNNYFENK